MSRLLNNSRCLLLLSALTAALLWLAPARSGRAAVYTYNTRQRTINAGVVFAGSAADLAFFKAGATGNVVPDPAPYLFHVLNLRPDVKPVGWSFVNPLAPANVTTAINTRWAGAYQSGAALAPEMAAYWEVPLRDVSADDLQQYDVLYLTGSYLVGGKIYPITFTPSDNEKLRRFVDNGGQLIVEYGVAANDLPNFTGVFPLFDASTWAAGNSATSLLAVPTTVSVGVTVSDLHPIITQPNFFSLADLLSLGAPDFNGNYGTIAPTSTNNIFGSVLLQGPQGQGVKDGVEAAQFGAGEIITSALNIGPTVSIWQGATFGALPHYFNQAPYAISGVTFYPPSVVPASDLKLLSNILSWADTHPTENKTSHQNAAGPSSASFSAAWSYPLTSQGANPPPGAAVWGNYVYVTDAAGVLHAFDAIPAEALTNTVIVGSGGIANPDDGIITDFLSTSAPKPYDEVWNASVGGHASAPTVASFGGTTYVFVEKADGSVVQYASVTGALVKTMTQPSTGPTPPSYPQGTTINAPAPTVYDGRVYAGQGDSTLFVYSLYPAGPLGPDSASGGVVIPVDPTKADTEYATSAPAVGLMGAGTISNNIIALVPTSQNMNTVLLGGRNDPLTSYSTNGIFAGYNVNRTTRYRLFNLFVDPFSIPPGQTTPGQAYDGNGGSKIPVTGGQDPVFGADNQFVASDDFYGDWDSDFRASTGQSGGGASNGSTLTLHEIKAVSLANPGGVATVSAPAIDRHGDYYYTVNEGDPNNPTNSYLFGVHDDVQQRNVLVKFRFRMPKTNDSSAQTVNGSWDNIDADKVNYNNTNTNPSDGSSQSLRDFHFVGSPVVDGQGNVYVAAQKSGGGVAAVLCFNADKVITADPDPKGSSSGYLDDATASFSQLDEYDGTTRNPIAQRPVSQQNAGRAGQMTTTSIITTPGTLNAARSGQATVFNFSRGSGGARQIAGNLTEPQPFAANPGPPANPPVNGQATEAVTMLFHTNLAWYTTFAVSGTISGLSEAGSTLMLCDSGSPNTLYKLPANPIIGAGKVAALTLLKSPLGTDVKGDLLSIGTVTAAPSAGGGAMVINGSGGIAAFNQQLTLIADSNRILEVDADGKAVWSTDATTRLQYPGVQNSPSTKVDFAHPSSLAQFAPNDYLVADTGNNRCVRFDRGGGVLWELTRFYDPGNLMAPGQPKTLSAPTSVEVRREDGSGYTDPYTSKPATSLLVHYLVADSGNDRIVEVTDTLDASGNVLAFDLAGNVVKSGTPNSVTHNHLLTWVTHTSDKYGRRYHYAGASYLDIPSGSQNTPDTIQIFALVTNARIAAPTLVSTVGIYPPTYALAAASSDAPGGSIIAFNRPTTTVPPAAVFPKPFSQLGPNDNDITYVASNFNVITTATQNYSVRNPRFLHVYAQPQAVPVSPDKYIYSLLYADDNGAFDLVYTGATTPPASFGLAFTQALYQGMVTPADFQGNVPPRGGLAAIAGYPAIPAIPFVPTCVQRLNDDATNIQGKAHLERYLITQSYSQGELGTILRPAQTSPPTAAVLKAGGEIFEVDVSTLVGSAPTIAYPGGFGAAVTLSRPGGASPLTQPTFAIRTTQ